MSSAYYCLSHKSNIRKWLNLNYQNFKNSERTFVRTTEDHLGGLHKFGTIYGRPRPLKICALTGSHANEN